MDTIRFLHLSDLHFGRIGSDLPEKIHGFIREAESHSPLDFVAISGDLTQRARSNQFREALQFIQQFTIPCIVVPGNHDLPLYNVLQRWLFPLRKYNKFLGKIASEFHSDKVDVVGVHTTNHFSVKSARYSARHWVRVREKFSTDKWRILMLHHPPADLLAHPASGAAFTEEMRQARPHIILSGHYHQSGAEVLSWNHKCVSISAGTATSTRTREEKNSFNVITLKTLENKKRWLECATFFADESAFQLSERREFTLEDDLL